MRQHRRGRSGRPQATGLVALPDPDLVCSRSHRFDADAAAAVQDDHGTGRAIRRLPLDEATRQKKPGTRCRQPRRPEGIVGMGYHAPAPFTEHQANRTGIAPSSHRPAGAGRFTKYRYNPCHRHDWRDRGGPMASGCQGKGPAPGSAGGRGPVLEIQDECVALSVSREEVAGACPPWLAELWRVAGQDPGGGDSLRSPQSALVR
jgi:hypothetical protein